MPPSDSTKPAHSPVSLGFWLLIAVIAFAPLFRAGLTPLAALMTQLLAVALLAVTLWSPKRLELKPPELLVLALMLLTPVIYLVPLPAGMVDALPGRGLYVEAAELLSGAAAAPAFKPLTLLPVATASAMLALLVPVAVFIATRGLEPSGVQRLVKVLLAVAALQALLGLLQFGVARSGLDAAWGVQAGFGGSATGTYPNRNHLAGLIEMMLPMALAFFFYNLGRKEGRVGAGGWSRKAAFWGSATGRAATVYGAVTLLLIVGVIFTRSRTGIFLTILGIILATLMFSRRIGGSNVFGPTGTIVSLAVAAAIAIGLAPVLDRFSLISMEDDARWTVFQLTLQGVGTFFPVGTGPGTFPAAFPFLQPVELGRFFVNRAHNDYLEWFFDAGVLGAAIPLLIIGLYVFQWTRIHAASRWALGRFLQVGAGIGLLLLALHELVDYNLYTPANQVAFAALAGIFFMPPERLAPEGPGHRRRRRRTPDLESAPASYQAAPSTKAQPSPPPDQIANPFVDD